MHPSRLLGPGGGKRKKEFCAGCFQEIRPRQTHVCPESAPLVDDKRMKEIEKQFDEMKRKEAEEKERKKEEFERGKIHGRQEKADRKKGKKLLEQLLREEKMNEEKITEIVSQDERPVVGMKKREEIKELNESKKSIEGVEGEEILKKQIDDEIESIEASGMKRNRGGKKKVEKEEELEEKDIEELRQEFIDEFFPINNEDEQMFKEKVKDMSCDEQEQIIRRFIRDAKNICNITPTLFHVIDTFALSEVYLNLLGFRVNGSNEIS